jgi:dihydrofolate reductase
MPGTKGNNTEIVSGDLVMYGCGRLGQTLLEQGLVDVLNLWIHPVILGTGEAMFSSGPRIGLRLDSVEERSSGVVSLSYVRKEPS